LCDQGLPPSAVFWRGIEKDTLCFKKSSLFTLTQAKADSP